MVHNPQRPGVALGAAVAISLAVVATGLFESDLCTDPGCWKAAQARITSLLGSEGQGVRAADLVFYRGVTGPEAAASVAAPDYGGKPLTSMELEWYEPPSA